MINQYMSELACKRVHLNSRIQNVKIGRYQWIPGPNLQIRDKLMKNLPSNRFEDSSKIRLPIDPETTFRPSIVSQYNTFGDCWRWTDFIREADTFVLPRLRGLELEPVSKSIFRESLGGWTSETDRVLGRVRECFFKVGLEWEAIPFCFLVLLVKNEVPCRSFSFSTLFLMSLFFEDCLLSFHLDHLHRLNQIWGFLQRKISTSS